MKTVAFRVAMYAIELPLMICMIGGFILLVALHFVASRREEESEDEPPGGMPKQPTDTLWQL